ncbi:ComEA family DNA-binding protein [Flavisolibacter nicotianae]|uniref:ComEA family DNA-binding protein n=1 Tax=Flavisolibacter nicotianae TaxID=2364882 RepID=UPI000EACB19C|nr:helix-hairpin-helix domain-containing protein [Flavisolibacter nicotianae]
MSTKTWLQDLFTFTKKDRIFAIFIVAVIAGSLFLPRFLAPTDQPFALRQDSVLVMAIDTLQHRQAKKPLYRREENTRSLSYEPSSNKRFTAGELFEFDPNTISLQDWQRMGLNDRTSKTIINYISKGGRFYRPEDLQKIWGMPQGFYERVKDYITITSVQRKEYPKYENGNFKKEQGERKPIVININEADTTALIALPGIGSRLSARIISFREKLGGFYSVDQIGETYGLPDSTFQTIKGRLQVDEAGIRKINLNTATKDELKVHPYIRWNLANAIVEYRNQHGGFKTLEELKNIVLIDEATFLKLSHYLGL